MAKRHKLAGNGVDLVTTLTRADLASIVASCATASTGDLWKGKTKVEQTGAGDNGWRFVIKDALMSWKRQMTFSVVIETTAAGSTRLRTSIDEYFTVQSTMLVFIPVGPKQLVAHHAYMQFAHKLANTVKTADASSRVKVFEGPFVNVPTRVDDASGAAPTAASSSAPVAAPTPVDSATPAAPVPSAAPAPSASEAPAFVAPPAVAADADSTIDDSTVAVPRRRRSTAVLAPDGAEPVVLTGRIVLGRTPSVLAPGDGLLALGVDEPTVSGTHARSWAR